MSRNLMPKANINGGQNTDPTAYQYMEGGLRGMELENLVSLSDMITKKLLAGLCLHQRKLSKKSEKLQKTLDVLHAHRAPRPEAESIEQTDMKDDISARMDILAGGVAHQINNPLMAVLHNLDSLSDDLPHLIDAVGTLRNALQEIVGSDIVTERVGESAGAIEPKSLSELKARVGKMRQGLLLIKDIVGNLTAFSSVENVPMSRTDLNQSVKQAVRMTANQTMSRAVTHTHLSGLSPIMASDEKMVQVFKHLIVNAVLAIDDGHNKKKKQITIRTWDEGGYAWAEVRDTGCGIPEEHLDKVFDPFFTTHATEQRCGLGLAITRRIVDGFGGEIRVESLPGTGARFLLRFPVVQTSSPSENVAISDERRRILVVDDQDFIREVVVSMLEGKHDALAVDSGSAAKEVLKTDTCFDLILCDLMMPVVSGIALHEWLVNRLPSMARRLVFMTGGVFCPQTLGYLDRVDNILVKKPFNRRDLLKVVDEQLLVCQTAN